MHFQPKTKLLHAQWLAGSYTSLVTVGSVGQINFDDSYVGTLCLELKVLINHLITRRAISVVYFTAYRHGTSAGLSLI